MVHLASWRRSSLALTAAVAGLSLVAACGSTDANIASGTTVNTGPAVAGESPAGAFKGTHLTFVSYGGQYQKGQEDALKDFEKTTGAEIAGDGPALLSKLQAQVQAKNVSWDIFDTDAATATVNCGTVFMKLDFTKIDVSKTPPNSYGDCYVPAMKLDEMLVYNKDKFGSNPPTGWKDFFDTTDFPGKRAMIGIPGEGIGPVIAALLADGVKPEDLYPIDFDRAYKKLDTIKDDLVFWDTGAKLQQLMESGEVSMAYAWSGRGMDSEMNGAHLDGVWNQAIELGDALAVPVGVRNPDAAMAALNSYLGASQQETMTEETSYSPVNTEAKPKLSAVAQKWLTTTPERTAAGIAPDWSYWSRPDIFKKQGELWDEWLSK